MKLPCFYSTKTAGSYATSVVLLNNNYGYISEKRVSDEDLNGYCECLDDLGIKHISQKDLIKEVYRQITE